MASKTYRLYRREPVLKGEWYYAVQCKGCSKPIFVFDDKSKGTAPVTFLGEGHLLVPCLMCSTDTIYSSTELFVVRADENVPGASPDRVSTSPSPRKPLWKTYPKAKAIFGVGFIEDRPAAAAIVARIITSWADVEVQSARLLAELMGTNAPPAAAVFGALRNSRTQHEALVAVAQIVLAPFDLELFKAFEARKASLEKERNDLAHGCFGVSVIIPDHIVWVAQADYLLFYAANGDTEEFRRKQFVYEIGTLERIAQEISDFHAHLGLLIAYLSTRDGDADTQAVRRRQNEQLSSHPQIRQALKRVRATKDK